MVRQGTLSFLARSLQTSRQAPTKADLDVLAPAMVGQLGDSQEPIRSAAADGVGTFLKIFGERPMNAYLENVSPPHMAKIKEASEKVTVQSKMTKAAPPAAKPQSEPAAPPKPEGPKIPARLAARFGATKTAAAEPKPDEIPEVLPEKPAPRPASVASAAASQAASAPSPDIPDESAFAPVKKPAAMPARLMARAAPVSGERSYLADARALLTTPTIHRLQRNPHLQRPNQLRLKV
jgi:cytoskeleton-associated protein 5